MQEKSDLGPDEASAEGLLDQHEQQTHAMRMRTFTRWMNLLLQNCDPPLVVRDLLAEVQDGRVLMALLEQLSGCKLLYRFRSSPQRIFRLNNISKVLSFLEDRHVKLSGVDLSGITDGVPSVVLNLIWNIILHFQVKLVVRGLKGHLSPSNSSSKPSHQGQDSSGGGSSTISSSYSRQAVPRTDRRADVEPEPHDKTIGTLLQLVQTFTSRFGVQVQDFGRSWSSGIAMVALIRSINPALIDLRESLSRDPRQNIELAFEIAHRCLDIPPLLESEDLCASPDEQCVITYVSMFLRHYSPTEDSEMNDDVPSTQSLGPVSLGETPAQDPEAQMFLQGLETSSELLLWKKWSRRPAGASEQSVSCAAPSTAGGRRRSTVNPPSPLDTGVRSQEIQSWMKEAERTYRKERAGGSCLSLSSEEGIYSLSVLDSEDEEEEEEEEACSNILGLSQQVFPPFDSHTHLKASESVTSEALQKYENCGRSGCRRMVGSTDVIDSQSEEKKQSGGEECGAVEAPRGDDGCEEVTENAGLVTRRCDKTPSEIPETQEMDECWKEEPLEQSGRCPRDNREAASEAAKEDDSLTRLSGARDDMGRIERKECWTEERDDPGEAIVYTGQQRDGKVEVDDSTSEGREGQGASRGVNNPLNLTPMTQAKRRNKETKTDGCQVERRTERNVHFGDTLWSKSCIATDHTLREEGFSLEASVAHCDITPLELHTLLALWTVIYCCFILHQMNS